MRGIPRQAVAENLPIEGTSYHAADVADRNNFCRWNPDMWGVNMAKPGGQAYYDSIARLYASWGVDFIKADDMGSHRFQPAEIQALSRAIQKTGRPMVLSISPGPAPLPQAAFLETYAQMWRISDDFWDDWKLLKRQFDYTRDWAPYVGQRGTWPDADMLPLGKLRVTAKEGGGSPSKFTTDEQQTAMTLWCISRSPLIFGGDLPSNDAATTALITNREVLQVDQQSSGNRQVLQKGNVRAWRAQTAGGKDYYVAVFNLGEQAQEMRLTWSGLGVRTASAQVRDLWRHKDLGRLKDLQLNLRPHASALYRVAPQQGRQP
ncbi:MAG TPA: glycoside hydrolase family 27 protein, partial [Terriglobales bacterium]|nr:glycoside hydrolase family 27 protein [Terriglobales bacterium]